MKRIKSAGAAPPAVTYDAAARMFALDGVPRISAAELRRRWWGPLPRRPRARLPPHRARASRRRGPSLPPPRLSSRAVAAPVSGLTPCVDAPQRPPIAHAHARPRGVAAAAGGAAGPPAGDDAAGPLSGARSLPARSLPLRP